MLEGCALLQIDLSHSIAKVLVTVPNSCKFLHNLAGGVLTKCYQQARTGHTQASIRLTACGTQPQRYKFEVCSSAYDDRLTIKEHICSFGKGFKTASGQGVLTRCEAENVNGNLNIHSSGHSHTDCVLCQRPV